MAANKSSTPNDTTHRKTGLKAIARKSATSVRDPNTKMTITPAPTDLFSAEKSISLIRRPAVAEASGPMAGSEGVGLGLPTCKAPNNAVSPTAAAVSARALPPAALAIVTGETAPLPVELKPNCGSTFNEVRSCSLAASRASNEWPKTAASGALSNTLDEAEVARTAGAEGAAGAECFFPHLTHAMPTIVASRTKTMKRRITLIQLARRNMVRMSFELHPEETVCEPVLALCASQGGRCAMISVRGL
mmetsp:Transcript_17755/g.53597  ORF Transcript_17755/g.53597 Transcript_17755/m.53597 type:complete len:247 (+) Transcript_17755:421-1161(+)